MGPRGAQDGPIMVPMGPSLASKHSFRASLKVRPMACGVVALLLLLLLLQLVVLVLLAVLVLLLVLLD